MSLLTELGIVLVDSFYKYVAPRGALRLSDVVRSDCKSAIRQIENLRYNPARTAGLPRGEGELSAVFWPYPRRSWPSLCALNIDLALVFPSPRGRGLEKPPCQPSGFAYPKDSSASYFHRFLPEKPRLDIRKASRFNPVQKQLRP